MVGSALALTLKPKAFALALALQLVALLIITASSAEFSAHRCYLAHSSIVMHRGWSKQQVGAISSTEAI